MKKFKEALKKLGLPYREIMLPKSKYNIKSPNMMTPQNPVVHNTANSAPAINEILYMNRNNSHTSFHLAVDEKEAILAIPFNRMAYHAGTRLGNTTGIGVEIARSNSDYNTFIKAEDNGAKVIAAILYNYNWGLSKVKKHQDYSGKYCPHRTLDLGWKRFLNKVDRYLKILKEKDINTNTNKEELKIMNKKYRINDTIRTLKTLEKNNENFIRLRDLNKITDLKIGYDKKSKMATINTTSKNINIDGENKVMDTININNTNYVKLRDFVKAFDLDVKFIDGEIKIMFKDKDILINNIKPKALNINNENYIRLRDVFKDEDITITDNRIIINI